MKPTALLSGFLAFSLLGCLGLTSARDIDASRMALERRYTTPHSLGDNYTFDPRDGWQTVNTSNLLYKYSNRDDHEDDVAQAEQHNFYSHGSGSKLVPRGHSSLAPRSSKKAAKKSTNPPKKANKSAAGLITGSISKIIDTIKGIGKPEPVTITW